MIPLNAGDVITNMVKSNKIEEVPENAVTQASNLVGDQMLASIAISLKRLADSAERIAESLHHMDNELAHPEWGVAPTIRTAAKESRR